MNKRHYKVIFSRVLNQLVVVSELAKSQGKAQSENVSSEQEKTGLFSTALSLNPIHFSLMLALGFVFCLLFMQKIWPFVQINLHQVINNPPYFKQRMVYRK